MIKNILGIMLIVLAIIFIYPIQTVIVPSIVSIFMNNNSDSNLIRGFGEVRIESYERCEKKLMVNVMLYILMKNKQI